MVLVFFIVTPAYAQSTEVGTLTDPTPSLTVFEANSFFGYNHTLGSYSDVTVPSFDVCFFNGLTTSNTSFDVTHLGYWTLATPTGRLAVRFGGSLTQEIGTLISSGSYTLNLNLTGLGLSDIDINTWQYDSARQVLLSSTSHALSVNYANVTAVFTFTGTNGCIDYDIDRLAVEYVGDISGGSNVPFLALHLLHSCPVTSVNFGFRVRYFSGADDLLITPSNSFFGLNNRYRGYTGRLVVPLNNVVGSGNAYQGFLFDSNISSISVRCGVVGSWGSWYEIDMVAWRSDLSSLMFWELSNIDLHYFSSGVYVDSLDSSILRHYIPRSSANDSFLYPVSPSGSFRVVNRRLEIPYSLDSILSASIDGQSWVLSDSDSFDFDSDLVEGDVVYLRLRLGNLFYYTQFVLGSLDVYHFLDLDLYSPGGLSPVVPVISTQPVFSTAGFSVTASCPLSSTATPYLFYTISSSYDNAIAQYVGSDGGFGALFSESVDSSSIVGGRSMVTTDNVTFTTSETIDSGSYRVFGYCLKPDVSPLGIYWDVSAPSSVRVVDFVSTLGGSFVGSGLDIDYITKLPVDFDVSSAGFDSYFDYLVNTSEFLIPVRVGGLYRADGYRNALFVESFDFVAPVDSDGNLERFYQTNTLPVTKTFIVAYNFVDNAYSQLVSAGVNLKIDLVRTDLFSQSFSDVYVEGQSGLISSDNLYLVDRVVPSGRFEYRITYTEEAYTGGLGFAYDMWANIQISRDGETWEVIAQTPSYRFVYGTSETSADLVEAYVTDVPDSDIDTLIIDSCAILTFNLSQCWGQMLQRFFSLTSSQVRDVWGAFLTTFDSLGVVKIFYAYREGYNRISTALVERGDKTSIIENIATYDPCLIDIVLPNLNEIVSYGDYSTTDVDFPFSDYHFRVCRSMWENSGLAPAIHWTTDNILSPLFAFMFVVNVSYLFMSQIISTGQGVSGTRDRTLGKRRRLAREASKKKGK